MNKTRASKKKYNNKRIGITISVIVIIALLATSYFIFFNRNPEMIFNKPKEEDTMNMLGGIELLSDADYSLLEDYELVLAMLMSNDMSDYSTEIMNEIYANEAVVRGFIDAQDLANLESAINTLAASIDKPLFSGEAGEMFYSRGLLILNKVHSAPANFAPGDRSIMMNAFYEMQAAAMNETGISLNPFSRYRSYYTQESLYNRYVAADGEAAASRYSAKPGYSEHQSGLAMDIGDDANASAWAETTFDHTDAAIWLAENAHKYGFILRYQEGKEEITGYMHESWHFRYVGGIATKIYESGLTLEEYLALV